MRQVKVSARQLVKRFGSTLAADHVDLDIEAGEFLTLLGSSGCGKTTLMRMIAGLEAPDRGAIAIDGRDVTHLPPRQRQLGMVFQQYSLFPHMSVAANIGYGLRARGESPSAIHARVDEMLALVELPHLRDRKPGQLSGGQQQRVALARALATRPSVLMLDEPLGALDLKLRRQLQTELKRIHRGTGCTFLFVTHDQEEALYLSDRIAVMRNGRIEQLAAPATVYLEPANEFVADFIGDVSFLDGRFDDRARRFILPTGESVPCDLQRPAGPVRLAVRPENAQLVQPGEVQAEKDSLTGTLTDLSHQTGTTLCSVRLADGQEIKLRSLGLAHGATLPNPTVRVRITGRNPAFDIR